MSIRPIRAMPYEFSGKYEPPYVKTPELRARFLANAKRGAHHLTSFERSRESFLDVWACRYKGEKTVLFCEAKGLLAYAMELVNFDASPEVSNKIVSQTSVWRDPNLAQYTGNVAAQVFWKYLVTGKRSVSTDSSQSSEGKLFWRHRVGEAALHGCSIHGLQCEAQGSTLKITSKIPIELSDFDSYYTSGRDTSGTYLRILIEKGKK